MKISEGRLRRIIRNIIKENIDEMSFEEIESIFSTMKIENLRDRVEEIDLKKTHAFCKDNSDMSITLKPNDIVLCSGAIPENEEFYNSIDTERYYKVVGFSEEEFENKGAGSSYMRSSIFKADSVFKEIVYLVDPKGSVFYVVIDGNENIEKL